MEKPEKTKKPGKALLFLMSVISLVLLETLIRYHITSPVLWTLVILFILTTVMFSFSTLHDIVFHYGLMEAVEEEIHAMRQKTLETMGYSWIISVAFSAYYLYVGITHSSPYEENGNAIWHVDTAFWHLQSHWHTLLFL